MYMCIVNKTNSYKGNFVLRNKDIPVVEFLVVR